LSSADFQPGPEFFDQIPPSEDPSERRTLIIGPFMVHLEGISNHLLPALDDHFKGFVEKGLDGNGLRLPVRWAGIPHFLDPRGDWRRTCVQRAIDDRIFVYGHYFAAWFAPAGAAGMMVVCRAGWMGLRVPLEILLRVHCAWRAIESDGFLLHAASIVRDGRAFVFFGHSGAGKTTVSKLSRGSGFILSDDITLITREGNEHRAHSVPFRGPDRQRVIEERRTYPLAGLYHLVQAPRTRLERLPQARAVGAVLSCLPFVTERLLPREPVEMMSHLDRALRQIPVFRLEFTRSAEFWESVLASV